jgi:O-antigen ligase
MTTERIRFVALARPGAVTGRTIAALLAAAVLSVGFVAATEMASPSLPLALAAGVGGIGLLALTLGRFDAAVALGFSLMAVVEFEPAPPDAAFALIIAVSVASGLFRPSRAPVVVTASIAALLVLNVLSVLAAEDLVVALRFGGITAFLAVMGLWIFTWVDSPRRARVVVVTWLAGAVLSSIVGVAVVYLPVDLPGRALLMDGTLTRANVFFEDANVFGPFLVPIAAILLEERLRPRLLRLRPALKLAFFLILALGVLVSFSRAGWINFVVAIVVMLGVTALRQRGGIAAVRMLGILVAASVAALTLVALTGNFAFLTERAKLQSYDTERFDAQRAGVAMAGDHVLGVGPGQFQFHHPLEAHSTYVRVLGEQGVLGLVAWLVLSGGTLFLALRNVVHGRDAYGIGSAALLGSWCGLLVNSLVVDTLHWRHLWVVAALIWAADLHGRTRDVQAQGAAGSHASAGLRYVGSG